MSGKQNNKTIKAQESQGSWEILNLKTRFEELMLNRNRGASHNLEHQGLLLKKFRSSIVSVLICRLDLLKMKKERWRDRKEEKRKDGRRLMNAYERKAVCPIKGFDAAS